MWLILCAQVMTKSQPANGAFNQHVRFKLLKPRTYILRLESFGGKIKVESETRVTGFVYRVMEVTAILISSSVCVAWQPHPKTCPAYHHLSTFSCVFYPRNQSEVCDSPILASLGISSLLLLISAVLDPLVRQTHYLTLHQRGLITNLSVSPGTGAHLEGCLAHCRTGNVSFPSYSK